MPPTVSYVPKDDCDITHCQMWYEKHHYVSSRKDTDVRKLATHPNALLRPPSKGGGAQKGVRFDENFNECQARTSKQTVTFGEHVIVGYNFQGKRKKRSYESSPSTSQEVQQKVEKKHRHRRKRGRRRNKSATSDERSPSKHMHMHKRRRHDRSSDKKENNSQERKHVSVLLRNQNDESKQINAEKYSINNQKKQEFSDIKSEPKINYVQEVTPVQEVKPAQDYKPVEEKNTKEESSVNSDTGAGAGAAVDTWTQDYLDIVTKVTQLQL